MIHPATELRHVNDSIGYGVFATAFIPAGSITWVRCALDQIFEPDHVSNLPPEYHPIIEKYSFTDTAGRFVLCWDNARYMNHSCEPTAWDPATNSKSPCRDLQPGDELTDDYGALNLRHDFVCACHSPHCRKIIHPDDMDRLAGHWDAAVEPLLRRLHDVPQPLWPFLREQKAVEQTLANVIPYRSIRMNRTRCG